MPTDRTRQGVRFQRAREDAGLSQSAAATALHVHTMTLSKYERGLRVPSVDVVRGMAELYGVTPDFLLSRSEAGQTPLAAQPVPGPFAEHVLFTAGRIAELAQQIAQAAERQLGMTQDLGRRSAEEMAAPEFKRLPSQAIVPVPRPERKPAPKARKPA